MYFFFGILFLILLFFFCINHWRRKKIIKKICSMCMDEKCRILNGIIAPFGYSYVLSQDIFTSRIDAWQRDFGYCALYDKAASHFSMVFDCLPVYFDYQGRTWLIEFWKGQYGINTGCEIGVYYADRILSKDELQRTLFQCADNENMLKLSFTLTRNNDRLADLYAKHWWLTAFRMGCFSEPADLSLQASISFKSSEMANAFFNGLIDAGYSRESICICCNTVRFIFDKSGNTYSTFQKIRIRMVQWMNRFFCKIYLFVTRPFDLSIDRLLYLYYYLPFAFRKMLRIRKYKRYKPDRR
ncbi:MAG: DUF4474 domain-containing protein [Lachnospiraceae bacterium]|nr:DUF4474 domain-containing protein [Lachnospiraceae bacterium]MBD5456449.1 DUF4474 domain-containing protein [Lachnospiraceae bacterium]